MNKMNKTIYIEEYAHNIPLLLSNNDTGFIHSVFNNGLNIKMGNRLLFIGTTKNGKLPFGAHLAKDKYYDLLVEKNSQFPVKWINEQQTLIFNDGELIVSFEKANVYDCTMHERGRISEMCTRLETVLATLLNDDDTKTGLDLSIESFVLNYLQANRLEMNETANQLEKLAETLFAKDKMKSEAALRYVLGRGKGLTPSGDDHVVGLLAVHAASHAFTSTFPKTVLSLVENESITTDVAKEYLYYAVHGQFSRTVTQVMHDLIHDEAQLETSLERLLEVGHSSGVDTIFGILLGLLAWRRKQVCQKK
ncbi:DUF2877 domain-containing protein [Paracerasibacillus soli]|uniref:DUF2877 domain-containing protein n=2 Tax=Paracerasibacillus soli TaxID=480284 RepID=A0ABU5CRS3_9BACI|nr:DUF2877 domain-containing protein [Virgibacillus soli]MDY0409067.1 DUF2877 domain-containing protein [Virgibacillus soli]